MKASEIIKAKAIEIAENEQKVYKAGHTVGYEKGYEQGYEQGMKDVPTQEKTVVPSAEIQEVLPNENYLLSKVIVKEIPKQFLDMEEITDFSYACKGYDYYTWNTIHNVILEMFREHRINTSKVTNFTGLFYVQKTLTEIPEFDTSNATNMKEMFYYCQALTEIPTLDTSKVTNMSTMFYFCKALTKIPALDTSKVTNMSSMFNNCTALTEIKELDLISVTNVSNMFNACQALTTLYLKNIKISLQVASGTRYGHLIALECLLFLIKEVINTGSAIKLTMGSANLAKLEGIYVKLIDITDEMRAEDEFIDSKYPFEVCESTDEGAMLLKTDYVQLKGLTLA